MDAAGVVMLGDPLCPLPHSQGNLEACRQLKALLREHRFDLIHVHTPVAAFLGRYLAKKTGQGPVLYTAYGFHFYKGAPWKNWVVYYTAERLPPGWADGLIVMNGEDYENARRMGFEPDKNLFTCTGWGVDLKLLRGAACCVRHPPEFGFASLMCGCLCGGDDSRKIMIFSWKDGKAWLVVLPTATSAGGDGGS